MRHPAPWLVVAIVTACGDGDDDSVPFSEIPSEKRLVDLTSAEERGVCAWGSAIARERLPAPGTRLDCDGLQITFNGVTQCGFPSDAQSGCEATVGEWAVCFPRFVDRLAVDPCVILDLLFPEALSDFIEETPGCEGMGACSYVTG